MILVINADKIDVENSVLEVVKKYAKHFNVKSRNMTETSLDMVVELRTSQGSELVKGILLHSFPIPPKN